MAAEEETCLFLQSFSEGSSNTTGLLNGLCFELEAKHSIMVFGFEMDLVDKCSVCIQTSNCSLSEVDLENSKGTEWTPVYSDAKMMAGRTRVKFDQPVAMGSGEKRCFFCYKNQGNFFSILKVELNEKEKPFFEDENLFLHGSHLFCQSLSSAEYTPRFSLYCSNERKYSIVGGVLYQMSDCHIKPAKR